MKWNGITTLAYLFYTRLETCPSSGGFHCDMRSVVTSISEGSLHREVVSTDIETFNPIALIRYVELKGNSRLPIVRISQGYRRLSRIQSAYKKSRGAVSNIAHDFYYS